MVRGLVIAIAFTVAGMIGIDQARSADHASTARAFEAKRMVANGAAPRSALADAEIEFAADEELLDSTEVLVDAGVQFRGLSWGVGFGVSQGFDDVIGEARVVNGIIVSENDETQQARLILEAHQYRACGESKIGDTFGCGPAGFIVTGQQDVLAGVGFGFMFGWKSPDEAKGTGFSIGIGALLDNDIKALADGFEVGGSLPSGETEIRFESKARWSGILFFTRTF
jgi:hypothetical protein